MGDGLLLWVMFVDAANVVWHLLEPDAVLLPRSVQFPGHVTLGVSDGHRAVPPGPTHPGDPGLQSPLRLHRQAALQAPLL